MVTQTRAAASSALSPESRQKVKELRDLFADAPETARTALEDVIGEAASACPAARRTAAHTSNTTAAALPASPTPCGCIATA